tara:strand:+ start:4912 stop:5613 length:702 start_codon:yes stop_codon:yes gene_type:complete
MYDHQTGTLWSQFLSRGVKGPLADTSLEIVPAVQTTWLQWVQLHPDTVVLDKKGRYQSDTYEGYYQGGSAGILGESNKDKRLPRKDLVLGVSVDGAAKAYPFSAIADEMVINDFFSGRNVLVTFDPASETGAIFDRKAGDRTLTFSLVEEESPQPPFTKGGQEGLLEEGNPGGFLSMRDQETGSTWQVVTGRAVAGPLAGSALERLPSHYSFWFAWGDFHPDTELYGGSGLPS